MATRMIVNGRSRQMSIEEKAAQLEVIDIHQPGTLAVRSGSDPRIAYAITHSDFKVTDCACTGCRQYGRTSCAYRLAAQRKLNEMRRDWFCQLFSIYE